VIEFIKKNISIFNIIIILLLFISIVVFISSVNEPDYHGFARGFSYFFLVYSLLLLLLDFVFRKFINYRINLNILQAGLFILGLTILINL
jgi:hypothetical protein